MNRVTLAVIAATILTAVFASPPRVHAHDRTNDECREASDMVMHFAEARDAGSVDKAEAMRQYDASVVAVSAYPPKARWFVEDDDDVALLRDAVLDVFDHPEKTPRAAKSEFTGRCRGSI